jgi:hypothetical protein
VNDGGKSRLRIETIPEEGREAACLYESAVTGSLDKLALRLPAGVYTVDVLLVSTTGKTYTDALEVEIVIPDGDSEDRPATPNLEFTPDASAFVSENEAQNLTAAVTVKLTADNSGGLQIVETGGGGAARTWGMKAVFGINTVYFVMVKKETQTLSTGGAGGSLVSITKNGPTR